MVLIQILIIIGKVARMDGINDQPKNSFISSMFLKIYKYVMAKLITTSIINLVKKIKVNYPDYNFIPIFWMASEDHDFEEINHFNFFELV